MWTCIVQHVQTVERRPDQGERRCPSCEVIQPIDAFERDSSKSSGRRSHCRKCRNAQRSARERAQRRDNPDAARARERARNAARRPGSYLVRPTHLACEGGCGTAIEQDSQGTKLQRWCRPCRDRRYYERYTPLATCLGCGAEGRFGSRRRCPACQELREQQEAAKPAPRQRSAHPSYESAHLRIRSQRGRASTMTCFECGGNALEWAYNHSGVEEYEQARNGGKVYKYSADVHQYDPLCKGCHNKRDGAGNTKESYPDSPLKVANDARASVRTAPHRQVSSW